MLKCHLKVSLSIPYKPLCPGQSVLFVLKLSVAVGSRRGDIHARYWLGYNMHSGKLLVSV